MSASELSEQIRERVEAGEWAQAMMSLAEAWNDASEFGTVACGLPDYPDVWVRFATHGYPFSLRRQWSEANDDSSVVSIILPRVVSWSICDVSGNPVPLPDGERTVSLIDNVDEALVVWLSRAFFVFWRRDLPTPRKN